MNSLEKAMLMGWDEEKTPARRKSMPVYSGVLKYFPNALKED